MSATREELRRLLESLPEERLDEVRDLMVVLTKEPEDLTAGELEDVRLGEEELRSGDWVWWKDVKRKDVSVLATSGSCGAMQGFTNTGQVG